MIVASQQFVTECLPGGVIPSRGSEVEQSIVVPFAVLIWDENLDCDSEGNSYPDGPPGWELIGAFTTQSEAEEFTRTRRSSGGRSLVMRQNEPVDHWEFTYCRVYGRPA